MTYEWRDSKFPTIEMRDLLVPLERCFTVQEGPVALRIVEELERLDFSQAVLVTDGPDRQYGLVAYDRLVLLNRDGRPLRVDDEWVDRSLLHCEGREGWRKTVAYLEFLSASRGGAPKPSTRLSLIWPLVALDQLLEALSSRSSVLVGCHGDPFADGDRILLDEPETIGLVTLADLNRQGVRAVMYPLLARLEGSLAALVEHRFQDDPWEWVMRLTSEDSRARIVGYWKLSEREGVNVGATAGAMLSELLRAVGADGGLRDDLGFTSREAFEKATKHLHRFRNLTMHPVRPLIRSTDDCRDLRDALASAIELHDNVPVKGP